MGGQLKLLFLRPLISILLLLPLNTTAFYTQTKVASQHYTNTRRSKFIIIKIMAKAKQSPATTSRIGSTSKTAKKMKQKNIRWAIRGIAGELFYNVFLRHIARGRKFLNTSTQQRLEDAKVRLPVRNEVAIVTGATGGIGSQMAHELAFRGYDVIIAARNSERAKELVLQIQQKLDNSIISSPNKEVGRSEGSKLMPKISFIEYHADIHQSALDLASKLEVLEPTKPLTVLINNAGIMGASESKTMNVNLIGPAMLTFSLLPLMMKKNDNNDNQTRRHSIKIINVSSSAHLRAACVFEEEDLRMKSKSLMSIFSNSLDDNLSTYAKSKLALLQFSSLLRHKLSKDKDIHILDAHPGLVWTSLLRNHIGDGATNTLQKTGLAGLIYKSPSEGAQAILACLDHSPITNNDEQVYFVNGEPGGYASPESRDLHQSELLLDRIIAPELREIVKFPEGF
jgi:NAD(P)-dependent dehydrogenase (short-subunit alcohol dehydrogenase family)